MAMTMNEVAAFDENADTKMNVSVHNMSSGEYQTTMDQLALLTEKAEQTLSQVSSQQQENHPATSSDNEMLSPISKDFNGSRLRSPSSSSSLSNNSSTSTHDSLSSMTASYDTNLFDMLDSLLIDSRSSLSSFASTSDRSSMTLDENSELLEEAEQLLESARRISMLPSPPSSPKKVQLGESNGELKAEKEPPVAEIEKRTTEYAPLVDELESIAVVAPSLTRSFTRKKKATVATKVVPKTTDKATAKLPLGAPYYLKWEEGMLGLRLRLHTDSSLPTVTNLTGKSSVVGIHHVKAGDVLTVIGDRNTASMSLTEVMSYLKKVYKPCRLEFRRADPLAPALPIPAIVPLSAENFTTAFAQKLATTTAAVVDSLPLAIHEPPPALSKKSGHKVTWKAGSLGITLVHNLEWNYPQVTRLLRQISEADLAGGVISTGDFLLSIGSSFDTREHTFSECVKRLQTVKKPVTLTFCARNQNLPALNREVEYEIGISKQVPPPFTFQSKAGSAKGVTLADVMPNYPGRQYEKLQLQVGDEVLYVNDELVVDWDLKKVLRLIRSQKLSSSEILLRIRQPPRKSRRSSSSSSSSLSLSPIFTRRRRGSSAASRNAIASSSTAPASMLSTPVVAADNNSEKPKKKFSLFKRKSSKNSSRQSRSNSVSGREGDSSSTTSSSSSPEPVRNTTSTRQTAAARNNKKHHREVPKEYELVWEAGTKLGLILRPQSSTSRIPVVSRPSEKASEATLRLVRAGDILVAINSRPISMSKNRSFESVEEEILKAPRPTVLRFRRNTGAAKGQSTRRSVLGDTFSYEWEKADQVGLNFEPDGNGASPVVTNVDKIGDMKCPIISGDKLTAVDNVSVLGLSFNQSMQLLQSTSFPVTLQFQKKHS